MPQINALALLFFVIGLALHTLAQIDAIARAKNNPLASRVSIFKARVVPILVRSALSAALFTLILQGEFVGLMNALNVPIPSMLKALLDLHVGSGIAFLAGYAFDSGLAYIPVLKGSLPPSIDTMNIALNDAAVATNKAQEESAKAADAVAKAQAVAPEAK